jgi:hypothetical protein
VFVQVIKGKLKDQDRLKAAVERWEAELAPGAHGWLGTTAGVTEDGTSIAVIRFESEEAANQNNERPEQAEWWADAEQAFSGDVTFQNSTFVDVDTPGDPSDAGFVQVMQGKGTNPERARELMAQGSEKWADYRPDILGTLMAGHGDEDFTVVIYFSSEQEARAGESKEPPAELKEHMQEMDSLVSGPPTFYDLRKPWLSSPK